MINYLLFIDDLKWYSKSEKGAMLVMKMGKIVKSDGIQESYKHLGVLEADEVMVNEMKDKVKKEYSRRVRNILETS